MYQRLTSLGVVTLAVVTLGFAFTAAPAAAHAAFVTSTPAPDGTLAAAPGQISITFSETIARSSTLVVTGPTGTVLSGAPAISGNQISAALQGGGAGSYSVQWSNTSLDDGHDNAGGFQFTVAAAGAPAAQPAPAAPPTAAAQPALATRPAPVAAAAPAQPAPATRQPMGTTEPPPARLPATGTGLVTDTPLTAWSVLIPAILLSLTVGALLIRRRATAR